MTIHFIPTDSEFVEQIAKSMAYHVMLDEANREFTEIAGYPVEGNDRLENSFNVVFESLWASTLSEDEEQRNRYRLLAHAAISAINLKMTTI